MRTNKRGTVRINYDDGETVVMQGMVRLDETRTHAQVEYTDGSRKNHAIHTIAVHVIIADEAHEAMKGK